MAKFTIHNQHGDYMSINARTLNKAIIECDKLTINAIVCETYFAPSPFNKNKITEHGREVYRNFKSVTNKRIIS